MQVPLTTDPKTWLEVREVDGSPYWLWFYKKELLKLQTEVFPLYWLNTVLNIGTCVTFPKHRFFVSEEQELDVEADTECFSLFFW